MSNAFKSLDEVIQMRRAQPQEGSYTCYLFEKGLDKILKKVGEECAETIIAAKNADKAEISEEICDLIYHLFVMMNECDIPLSQVEDILQKRSEKIGNLKVMKNSDHNT